MKKKEKISKVIAGLLIPSVLLPSCSGYFIDNDVEAINEDIYTRAGYNSLIALSGVAVPMEINTLPTGQSYIEFINKLASDIINDPNVAKEFAQNPSQYLNTIELSDITINMDEGMLKLILALGDDEIIDAINNNNLNLFFSLCNDKGLIENFKNSDLSKINELIAQNPEMFEDEFALTSFVAFFVALVVGVAAFVWGVAITHVAAVNVAAAATVAVAAYAAVTKTSYNSGSSGVSTLTDGTLKILDQVWTLKNDNSYNTYIFQSEYDSIKADNLIDALEQQFPEITNKISKSELKQIVSLNISHLQAISLE